MIFPDKKFWQFGKIFLIGPKKSVYNNGVYVLSYFYSSDYPQVCPLMRFVTYIYHCNVTIQGKICNDVLGKNWRPTLQLDDVLRAIDNMLLFPNAENALDSSIAAEFMIDREKYNERAMKSCKKHANKSIDDLMLAVLGNKPKEKPEKYEKLYARKKQEI